MSQQENALSPTVHEIFEKNFDQEEPIICAHCILLKNTLQSYDGSIIQVFCGNCQYKLSQNHFDPCDGYKYNSKCLGKRYVSPIGLVAPLCSSCHKLNLCYGGSENCLKYCQLASDGSVYPFCKNCRDAWRHESRRERRRERRRVRRRNKRREKSREKSREKQHHGRGKQSSNNSYRVRI